MKTLLSAVDWQKNRGLVPAIIQDATAKEVLMLGYMNKKSLEKTLTTQKIWFYSRSKKRLWQKGETSGHILKLVNITLDCDRDTLLIQAEPAGPTCHTGKKSCFDLPNRPNAKPQSAPEGFLSDLLAVIKQRQKALPKDSYTASLLQAGLSKICAKIQEESAEVIQAAKKEGKKRLIEESCDLLYHLMVLWAAAGLTLANLASELERRQKKS